MPRPPPDAEIAVRTTGLLTAGRNSGGQDGPQMPTVDEQGQQRYFQRVITPRPLDCGSGSPPRAGIVLSLALPRGTAQPPAPAKSNRRTPGG